MTAAPARAIRILNQTYWSASGWRPEPRTAPDDLAEAVTAGVMFDAPVRLSHDAVVEDVRRLVGATSLDVVANAFLASLPTRRLDLRSALGSYVVARYLPDHSFAPHRGTHSCAICGLPDGEREIDRNVLSFERFKWGGVRRDDC